MDDAWGAPPECFQHIYYREYQIKTKKGVWMRKQYYGPGENDWQWGSWRNPPKVGEQY